MEWCKLDWTGVEWIAVVWSEWSGATLTGLDWSRVE